MTKNLFSLFNNTQGKEKVVKHSFKCLVKKKTFAK